MLLLQTLVVTMVEVLKLHKQPKSPRPLCLTRGSWVSANTSGETGTRKTGFFESRFEADSSPMHVRFSTGVRRIS